MVVGLALLASVAGPAVAVRAAPDAAHRYRVRTGDTLSSIAGRFGVSVGAVAQANSIRDRNVIVIGRTLLIPAASQGSTGTRSSGRSHPRALTGKRLALMPVFEHWAAHYGMRADLLKAICYLESGWQAHAVSSTGAVGIGQLMPDTAIFTRQLIGLPLSRWAPEDNIHMSAKYLRWLLDQTGWNVRHAVASYYQGLGALRAHGMYPDTVAYVNAVLALQTRF